MLVLWILRTPTQESENKTARVKKMIELATISDSVPARPETSETSVESAVMPVVADSERFDHKEPDNGLCPHHRACHNIVHLLIYVNSALCLFWTLQPVCCFISKVFTVTCSKNVGLLLVKNIHRTLEYSFSVQFSKHLDKIRPLSEVENKFECFEEKLAFLTVLVFSSRLFVTLYYIFQVLIFSCSLRIYLHITC